MKRLREKCLECGEPIPTTNRVDSKFCTGSCKARYWRKKKEPGKAPKPDMVNKPKPGTPLEGLRGVMNSTIPVVKNDTEQKPYYAVQDCITEEKQIRARGYEDALSRQAKIVERTSRISVEMARCDDEIKKEKEKLFRLSNFKPKKKDYLKERYWSVDWQDLFGWKSLSSELEEEFNNKLQVEDSKRKLASLVQRKKELQCGQLYPHGGAILAMLEGIKRKKLEMGEQEDIPANIESARNEMKENEGTFAGAETVINQNNRIISSKQLMQYDYESLTFTGRWNDFIGRPAVIFHLAVHGSPGEGKSTFCLQFADYLADNFGNVIYISGEEGYSKTLKDKVVRVQADSKNLYFHDAKNMGEIMEQVPANQFRFIFIDSLDTLRIDAVKLKELKKHYPKSAIVTISQSTKDGKMRGSNEIIHDADIAIKVTNGIALTTKNRFKEKGREFTVFGKS